MIPKRSRLLPTSFPKKAGVAIRTPLFVVKRRENTLGHNRFGVIVSATQEPSSVGRHAIRRRILQRAIKLPARSSDYLFIATGRAQTYTKERLDHSFHLIFQ
jgi:ribonuclease P protein component